MEGLLITKDKDGQDLCEHCEKNKIELFCQDCVDTFCNNCFENNHQSLKRQKHERKSVKHQVKKCPIHQETLKNYCFICDLNLCSACTLKSHKDHKQDFFDSAGEEFKKKITSKIEEKKKFYKENLLKTTEKLSFHKKQVQLLESELKQDEEEIIVLNESLKNLPKLESFKDILDVSKNMKMVQGFQGKCLKTLEGHKGNITCLIETKYGNIVSGSTDKTIKIWDKDFNCIETLEGHSDGVLCLLENRDELILSGSKDGVLNIWENGKCIKTLKSQDVEKQTHFGSSSFGSFSYVPSLCVNCLIETYEGYIAAGFGNGTINIWDMKGNVVQTLNTNRDSPISNLLETKDKRIICTQLDYIKIFNNGILESSIHLYSGGFGSNNINYIFEKNGTLFISHGNDFLMRTIESKDNENTIMNVGNPFLFIDSLYLYIISGFGKNIKTFDENGKLIQEFSAHISNITCLIKTKSGKIVSGSSDTTIKVWE